VGAPGRTALTRARRLRPLQACQRLFLPAPALDALQVLPAWAAAALRRDGWAVVPGFLPAHVAAAAREEALALHREGAFSPAPRHAAPERAAAAAAAPFTDASARGDAVLWLHPDAPPAACAPGLRGALDALGALRADLARLLALRRGTAEHQLAVYPPSGAAYARHRDAFPDDGAEADQRRVTAIVYANDPDWDCATAGGALRLHAPARGAREQDEAAAEDAAGGGEPGAPWVDVAPVGGTLVLFLSGAVEHEVLPCHAPRVAVTAWCQ
jgi:SM-20-related protein